MIEAGKLPAPEQHYKIESISYDPRLYNAAGGVLAVDHVPTSAEQHAGRITVFPPAAGAMETAVLAVAHEMWRFNKAEGHIHDKAYQYAQGAQHLFNGGTYVGPTPVYEREEQLKGEGSNRLPYVIDWSKNDKSTSAEYINAAGEFFFEIGRRKPEYREGEERNVLAAQREVERLIRTGRIPSPEKGYKLKRLYYDERIMVSKSSALGGLHIPTSDFFNEAEIRIFAPASVTIESAVKTFSHELWHFNQNSGDNETTADDFGNAVFRVWKSHNAGEEIEYDGPKP